MSSPIPSVAHVLVRWRNNLIDLTRRNPLIALRSTRTSAVELVHPEPAAIYDRLVKTGKGWSFWMPPVPEKEDTKAPKQARQSETPPWQSDKFKPKAHEVVASEMERGALTQTLTNLYRRAAADFRERGLHILHVACGVLEWPDPDGEPLHSPVVLIPVELKRQSLQEPFLLEPNDDEPWLNPALQARLKQDYNFSLPQVEAGAWDETTLPEYFDRVKQAIRGLPGWSLEAKAVLTLFSFFKGVMHQDLEENAGLIEKHPLVQVLAGVAAPALLPRVDVPQERELDAVQDPLHTFHILDADGSQRRCLEAALRGQSFVLQGPPGTGKSQTIANLIAHCLAVGKKVLFVSEKMAALEVVYHRLRHVGLGDFCLELHSHKANKREVVSELARCLTDRARQGEGAAATVAEDCTRLRDRRDRLNRYVQALHAVREPMRRSAWFAMEELARLQPLPSLPLQMPLLRQGSEVSEPRVVAEITPTQLDDMKQAVQRLGQLWHIATEQDFPWRGFKAERYNLQLRDEVLGLIDRVRTRLEKLQAAADQYGRDIGGTGPIHWLLKLGDLLEAIPGPIPQHWISASDFAALSGDLERCAETYQKFAQGRAPITARYGPTIWNLAEGSAAKIEQVWKVAEQLLAATAPGGAAQDTNGAGLLKHQQKLRGWAADTQQRLPAWLSDLRTIEKWLSIPVPSGAGAALAPSERAETKLDPSPHTLRQVLRLAHLCQSDNPPERPWLQSDKALAEAQALIAAAKPVFSGYHQRRSRLMQLYTERIFELDLVRLAEAFAGPYLRWYRFLNFEFRRDRRSIVRRSRGDAMPATAPEDMAQLRDLEALRFKLEGEAAQRRAVLGRYEKGLDTNVDAADRGARIAVEGIDLARQLGCETMPAKLSDALVSGAPPEKIRGAIKRLTESFGHWQHATQELKALLPVDHLPGTAEAFDDSALTRIAQYAKDLQAALNHLGGLTDPVLGKAPAPPSDLATLVSDVRAVEQFRVLEASQESTHERWAVRLGPQFKGVATDWAALRKCMTWTSRLRELLKSRPGSGAGDAACPGELPAIAAGTKAAPSMRDLKQHLEHYQQALHGFEIRFDAPGPMLQGKNLAEHPPEAVRQRLGVLQERVGQLADWVDYRQLPGRFHHLGLDAFLRKLQQEPPPPGQLADVFVKAFWTSWLEAVLQTEPLLSAFRRAEHDQLVAEFQELDRKLIQQTPQRIAHETLQRGSGAGDDLEPQKALLMKEAYKKTKHLPIRRLFEQLPQLLPQLKPCLLMSPLSVSQFLHPEKVHFDMVVFDEASQILPEDAVGAIYRASQVVITGDNKQLPPTTFFQQLAEEDEQAEEGPATFESILDAFLGAGLPQHLLRWHYRSRHESLIAFSNRRFYEQRLVTFPAAVATHEELGVKFVHVPDGVYDRGGRRDNPAEAKVVADLVLQHFQEDSHRTIGVIAFGYPQMTAIEDELERRLRERPELAGLFKSGRLEGFFVKNLETVQGDERDVILLSVGYGKDAAGKLILNFGPVNREGGARRLNVAVTRARQKLIVVSSIQAADLEAGASQASGLAHLREYLDYAQRGGQADGAPSLEAGAPTSPLAGDIAAELKGMGYQTVPQVGTSAFRLDLGVLDPERPAEFLLGIACDGPYYQGAGTARDRDRLCPQVLDLLGWRLHRIWAPAWLLGRGEEVARLRHALERARTGARK